MVAIGNEKANMFWEKHFQGERIAGNSPREIRENFIRSKYESKCWIPRSSGDTQEVLNKVHVYMHTHTVHVYMHSSFDKDPLKGTESLVWSCQYVAPPSPTYTYPQAHAHKNRCHDGLFQTWCTSCTCTRM